MKFQDPVRLASLFVLVVTGLALAAVPARAQNTHRDAVVGLFLKEKVRGNACTSVDAPGCNDEDLVVSGNLFNEYFAYVAVFNGARDAGVAGVEFGIQYDGASGSGVEILDWGKCGTLEFASAGWPASNTGTVVTWDPNADCQEEEPGGAGTGVTAVVGYFVVAAYSPDKLSIIPRPVSGNLKVADCAAAETALSPSEAAGSAGFSDDDSVKGNLPCKTITVEAATWGAIKNVSGSNR